MALPVFPTLAELLARAENCDCSYSVNDLRRWQAKGYLPVQMVKELFVGASPRRISALLGLSTYLGGACGTCGGTERYTASKACKPCHAKKVKESLDKTLNIERKRQWRLDNSDYARNYERARYHTRKVSK
jgi:hypothetical protein